jgi:CheY-like chemotaxis protein
MRSRAHALVVDDLAESRLVLAERLAAADFEVETAADGLAAVDAFRRAGHDLVVTDVRMPRLNGIGLVRRIRETSSVPIVVVTAYPSVPDCEEALRVGADRYLQLRRDLERVGRIARELLANSRCRRPPASGAELRHAAENGHGTARHGGALEPPVITAEEARRLGRRELRRELERQVVACRGNIAEIARRMGRDRSTIRYHLRRLGLLDPGVTERDEAARWRPSHADDER